MNDRVASNLTSIVIIAFVATWIVLGIGLFVASWKLDAATKRQWFPFAIMMIGVLFIAFTMAVAFLQSRSWSSLWILVILVPAVALISYLNITHTKFCDVCNATLIDQNWFGPPVKFCSKCGAPLDGAQMPQVEKPSTR